MSTIVTDHGVRFQPDVEITLPGGEQGGGFFPSLFLVRAHTTEGRAWLQENVDQENALWFGAHLVVEHRYIEALFDGMVDDGLVVR